jgi:hypothetical protein
MAGPAKSQSKNPVNVPWCQSLQLLPGRQQPRADLCAAGTFSAMLANVDDLDLLRHEFNAGDGSFLVQLRVDYHWLQCYHASTKRPSRSREAAMTLEIMTYG